MQRDNITHRENGHFKRAVWLSREDAVMQRHRDEKKTRVSPSEQWEAPRGSTPGLGPGQLAVESYRKHHHLLNMGGRFRGW